MSQNEAETGSDRLYRFRTELSRSADKGCGALGKPTAPADLRTITFGVRRLSEWPVSGKFTRLCSNGRSLRG